MDSYQHHNPYMRPPPPPPPQQQPSMVPDPNHHHYHHHQQQQQPPPPPPNTWYSGQFQYRPPQSPSPPPPPPQQQQQNHQQWAPQQQSYPPPPPSNPNNYHPPQQQQQQPYPLPPPPPPPYPPPPQDWGNTNWSHHSGWEHQGHSNEEDWAARARAWASARPVMENQHPQTQFTAIPRAEEHSHYPSQYSQPVESHYQDGQPTSLPAPSFQSYQAPPIAPLRPPVVHQQELASISSYAPEGHFSYPPKDGALGGDMSAAFSHREGSSSSSVHQQEVPSSYSSVPGREEGVEGRYLGHSLYPGDGRAVQMEQAQFIYSNHSLDPMDQPLDFVPRSIHEIDPNIRSGYPDNLGSAVGTDSVVAVSSLHSWTAPAPVSPGMSYPPIPPTFPSALQHDPSMSVSPLPGQPAPMFGQGPSFQQAVPSAGLGATTFPMDVYGSPFGSERSKKAAVPNWLREEIIKKKVTITSSVPEHSKEGRQSTEDESIDKSSGKGDQADSRSMDSPRSTEEEDDDEDYEEAQRVAAINQEIKRVLTEVLLKVTDELFDEIATKVLNEDDATADVVADADNNVPSHKTSPPPVPTPKASVKLLVPVKGKEFEPEDSSGESSSGLPGNVLGLANYASDDNENEHQTSSMPKSHNSAEEDGHLQAEVEEHSRKPFHAEGGNGSSAKAQDDHSIAASKSVDPKMDNKDLENGEAQRNHSKSAASSGKKGDSVVTNDRKSPVVSDAPESFAKSKKVSVNSTDDPSKRSNPRKSRDANSLETDSRRSHKHESRSSSGRDKEMIDEKAEGPGRREERHQKKDKAQDNNGSKERLKERSGKQREKTKESDSRKRSPYDDKDFKKERKAIGKEVSDNKREKTKDEKGDKSRHKSSSDRGRHKRRRSSSVSSRGKRSKESPGVSDCSVDNASEDSRSRKVHSKRRNLSPSPDRSRGRGRRSRSRSPVRRHR